MFESPSQSEPTEKERKVVEAKLRDESKWLMFDTFSALPEEEKKKRVTERWKREKNKVKQKDIPWRMLEPKIENVPNLARVLAGMTNRFLSNTIRNGGVSTQELARDASATSRRVENMRNALRVKAKQRTFQSLSPLTRDPIPNRSPKEIPVIEENTSDADVAELPPEYTYLENDTVTLPHVENGEGTDPQYEVVSGVVNEYAKSEAERYRDDPETTLLIETFYAEINKMLERGDIDAALRFLDGNLGAVETNAWSNELRAIALQLGAMKREQYGHPKIDFNDATFLLSKNAFQLFELYEETQEPSDMEGYSGLMVLLERMQDPTEAGERALEEALEYSERLLAFRTHRLNRSLHMYGIEGQDTQRENAEECRIHVEEAQRMRDAILEELWKRSEQSETEDNPNSNSDSSESRETPVPLVELLENPNLALSEADREDMRTVIRFLENDIRSGETGDQDLDWEKEMLAQVRERLQEGAPEVVERVDTILGGYVHRALSKKIQKVLNRTDSNVSFEDKKRLLELSRLSANILDRHDVSKTRDIRGVEAQIDMLLEKYT